MPASPEDAVSLEEGGGGTGPEARRRRRRSRPAAGVRDDVVPSPVLVLDLDTTHYTLPRSRAVYRSMSPLIRMGRGQVAVQMPCQQLEGTNGPKRSNAMLCTLRPPWRPRG